MSGKLLLHVMLDPEGYAALRRQGFLAGDRSRICSPGFEEPYEWMAGRMAERLPPPSAGVDPWPLWAWSTWRGQAAPDPLAEEYAEHDLWMVGFEIPARDVLLSDFHGWHHCLNGWYLPDLYAPDEGVAEGEAFDADLEAAGVEWLERPYPSPFRERVEESWKRVFDVNGACDDVQATFWRIDLAQVVSETPAGRLAVRAGATEDGTGPAVRR